MSMEPNLSLIFNFVLSSSLVILCVFFFRQRKVNKELQEELAIHTGRGTDALNGQAKFSELGLMCAGIAHELSNPLTIIQSRVELLLKTYRDPKRVKEITQGLQQIKYTSERIGRIVSGIRHYIYRNDELIEDLIPLNDIMESVEIFCGQRLKNHGIELRLKDLEQIVLRGHRGQLEQAFLNLINNSFDAVDMLDEKWIEISAVKKDDVVDIYFKDSGHGIAQDVTKNMLKPFYTTKEAKGTGLGLTLVKGIAKDHGGDLVYIERAPHTTFLLELPLGHAVH